MKRLMMATLAPLLLAASPPVPTKVLISGNDYPDAARRAGVEGDVAFTLTIDAKGKVSGCTVTEGANLPGDLANGTCAVVSAKWRYQPARDDAGQKVPSTLSYRFAWRIAMPCPKDDGKTLCVFL